LDQIIEQSNRARTGTFLYIVLNFTSTALVSTERERGEGSAKSVK